jgi:hypothetical protein
MKKLLAIFSGSLAIVSAAWAAVVITLSVVGLDSIPKCSDGVSLVRVNIMNTDWPACFASPTKFEVKIYSISLVNDQGQEEPLYSNANPSYVDIVGNNFNPIRDLTTLPVGDYTKVKMVVGSTYRITVDEQVPNMDGSTSRIISYETGRPSNWKISNTGISMGGNPNLALVFPRNTNDSAEPLEFQHNAYIFSGQDMTLSEKLFYTSDSNDRNSSISQYGAYFFKSVWRLTNSTISSITHHLNLNTAGNSLDLWGSSNPYDNVGRATITMDLASNFVYTGNDGIIINWTWDLSKMFMFGMSSGSGTFGGAATTNRINLIALGPYSFDLSFTAVPKESSGLNEVEAVEVSNNL